MGTFDEATANFSHWLKAVGQFELSQKIGIDDRRDINEGRCVIATDDIENKELLFEIPRASILNVETAKLSEKYPDVRKRLFEEFGHWEGLILCLLYEMNVLRDKSKWWDYFLVLPQRKDLQTLIFWPNEELQLLKPSLIIDRVGKTDAKYMFDRINGYVKEFPEEAKEEFGETSWEDFLYVASVIMSYSFDVENATSEERELVEENQSSNVMNDGYMKSMIPLADTLNSDTKKCNANLTYDIETLKMYATADIKKGGQVYNIYGDHPNAELLRRYGYVEWNGSKYDFAELPLTRILEEVTKFFSVDRTLVDSIIDIIGEKSQFFNLFEGEEIIVDSYDCYKDGHLPMEGILLIQILCLFLQNTKIERMGEVEKEKELFLTAKKSVDLLNSNRVTKKCIRLWERCIEARLNEYPTHAFREVCPNHEGVSNVDSLRQMMVDRVLQSEVESLQSCQFALSSEFKCLDDSSALDNIQKRKKTQKKQKFVKKAKT